MGSHQNAYEWAANALVIDPRDAGVIQFVKSVMVIPLTSGASAETRTLAQPMSAGSLVTLSLDVDGGGAITVTVTGGYDQAGGTTIVLNDAGDFITLTSVKKGSEFVWRVVGYDGCTGPTVEVASVDADTVTVGTTSPGAAQSAEHGAGAIGSGVAPATYRYTRDGTIITEIQVDLTGLDSSGVANDVIGLATGGAAYLGRNVVATNGVIFKVEMTCLEVPLTGDADVILVQGSAADEAFDDTVANTAAICDGTGDWVLGETIVNTAPAVTANYYYYLTQGAADDATYTAGQFLIRLYGHAPLA